jgi:hypothetical protein
LKKLKVERDEGGVGGIIFPPGTPTGEGPFEDGLKVSHYVLFLAFCGWVCAVRLLEGCSGGDGGESSSSCVLVFDVRQFGDLEGRTCTGGSGGQCVECDVS